MPASIVSWPIAPLEAESRGLGDRVGMAIPRLRQQVLRRIEGAPAGSPLRRAALTRAVRSGYAATNRDDYEMMRSSLHPEIEFHPPGRGEAGLGFESVYRGPDAVVGFVRQWKEGFERFRYEPRELADPGGARFGLRVGMIATAPGDVEVRDEYGVATETRDGLIFRQVSFYSWEEALLALEDPKLGVDA